jgi:hypothetical protein
MHVLILAIRHMAVMREMLFQLLAWLITAEQPQSQSFSPRNTDIFYSLS